MKSLAEKIAVMQAAERGEQIESKYKYTSEWFLNSNPSWDWIGLDYRVAPRTMEIVVVSWKRGPVHPFCLEKKSYDTRGDKEEMILHSTQTITY